MRCAVLQLFLHVKHRVFNIKFEIYICAAQLESVLHNHEFRKTKQNKMYVLHSCRSLNLYLSSRIRAFTPPTTPQNNILHKPNSKALFRKKKQKQKQKQKQKKQKQKKKNP